ncbi:MAG: EF-P beta-lysylation protein EpmB [Xanthomonadaceae bacterium]|nr:EF-P beta-lysylation protein EpmB [Xanthomonadaceae bacterium]MDE1961305.1 EF-P beta-lysylation protein EpmB [Xanthomonadaceae bacterium]MDE2083356.1 EF-P beta-lysylation protein EpmB [Xanthomonadaceae bacterium]
MITASPLPAQQPRTWQRLWREAIVDPRELLELLDLGHLAGTLLPARDSGFSLRVPRGFAARMRRGDAHDPLLLQVLPQAAESLEVAGFARDAVGDMAARVADGVLHKYAGRALLIATGSCAVNCRYCFRRHFPYAEETAAANRWREAIGYIRADASIEEVILSGGDPLSLATAKLVELTDALAAIPHIRRLRIHTRLPIVLPERVDGELLAWLRRLPWPAAIVLHANHANEIDASVADACARLRAAGSSLLNQSVLLRRINDNVQTLADLSARLFSTGVLPYYLHQLDRVAGTAHFAVDDKRAGQLIAQLRGRLSGYLVPRLVREIAGEPAKTPL